MVTYACFAYNGASRLLVRPTVYRDTAPVHQPAPQPLDADGQPDPNRLAVIGRLHLPDTLQPGTYSLEIAVAEAGDGRSQRSARQWIEFEIVPPAAASAGS
jgi:hypothetical protein